MRWDIDDEDDDDDKDDTGQVYVYLHTCGAMMPDTYQLQSMF